jgi:enoyl-CoA hydratase/carnithine racemase
MDTTTRRVNVLQGHLLKDNLPSSLFTTNVTSVMKDEKSNGWTIDAVWGNDKKEPAALLITMNSNPVNAIDETFVKDFTNTMNRLEGEFAQWHHQPLFFQAPLHSTTFCAGLNLKRILKMVKESPNELSKFLTSTGVVFEKLNLLPRPTVAFINGNAVAGGFVLAMCCDFRIIVDNPSQPSIMTLREVALGMPLPYFIGELMRTNLSGNVLFETTLTGRTYSPHEALHCGIVNRLVKFDQNPDALQEALIREAYSLINERFNTKLGNKAYCSIKTSLKTSNLINNAHMKDRVMKETLTVFTSQGTMQLIQEMLDSRHKKH